MFPEVKGDATTPALRPTVTLYVRTFRAMWNEEGAYDVAAEIDETVSHELEHHGHFLSGHDPMDEEERGEIAVEVARAFTGRKELGACVGSRACGGHRRVRETHVAHLDHFRVGGVDLWLFLRVKAIECGI